MSGTSCFNCYFVSFVCVKCYFVSLSAAGMLLTHLFLDQVDSILIRGHIREVWSPELSYFQSYLDAISCVRTSSIISVQMFGLVRVNRSLLTSCKLPGCILKTELALWLWSSWCPWVGIFYCFGVISNLQHQWAALSPLISSFMTSLFENIFTDAIISQYLFLLQQRAVSHLLYILIIQYAEIFRAVSVMNINRNIHYFLVLWLKLVPCLHFQ